MIPDVHVRIRRLIVPTPDEGDGQLRARDVIEAIERHVRLASHDDRGGGGPAAASTATRIGEAVGHSVRGALTVDSRPVT